MQPQDKVTEPVINQNTPQVNNAATTETETPEQINWKKFREVRAEERKAKEASDKRAEEKEAEAQALKAALDAVLNKPNNTSPRYDNQPADEVDETEDQRIEKKVTAALALREQQYAKQRQEEEQRTFPQRLQQTYNDFDKVCNTENLDYLQFHYPEVADAFKHAPDGFDKWSSVYKAVKRFVPNTDTKKDQAKAASNLAKPQAMNNAVTPEGSKVAYDSRAVEARRAENYARMQKTINRLG